jgi:Tfp pilus assembly protein PilO
MLHKRNIAVISAISGCFLAMLIFLYLPLGRAIRTNGLERDTLVRQLSEAGANLGVFKGAQVSKKLIRERDISSVIDAIAREGRNNLLDFKSISQGEMRPDEDNYPVLPVTIEIEGDYRQIGAFLGALENIKDTIVTAREFTLRRDDRILPKISAAVVLNIHLTKG